MKSQTMVRISTLVVHEECFFLLRLVLSVQLWGLSPCSSACRVWTANYPIQALSRGGLETRHSRITDTNADAGEGSETDLGRSLVSSCLLGYMSRQRMGQLTIVGKQQSECTATQYWVRV